VEYCEWRDRNWFRWGRTLVGLYVLSVASSGLAGAWATPLVVIKAKLIGSIAAVARQNGLFGYPVFSSSEKLSIFSAAHQRVASQLFPAGQGTHPGG